MFDARVDADIEGSCGDDMIHGRGGGSGVSFGFHVGSKGSQGREGVWSEKILVQKFMQHPTPLARNSNVAFKAMVPVRTQCRIKARVASHHLDLHL